MGFYGNITNTNKTQFTFDRTYPNRKTMEARLATDKIYLGRYVLIEYDTDGAHTLDTYLKCYVKNGASGEEFYTSPNFDAKTRVKWSKANAAGEPSVSGTVVTGELIYVEKDLTPEDKNNAISQVFYKCINDNNSVNGDIAEFKLISASESNYTKNYNIDTAVYGEGRGYDSTVWQKVYTQGTEKYVMIAELNSVVPTFDLSADAPTMEPVTPHFDADSTNVYYKLHWQPAWGFRVAKASGTNSDTEVVWQHSSYDPTTDKVNTSTERVAGAINFNEPGFNETTPNVDNSGNYITVLPTGLSGKNYNTHDGTGVSKPAPDIQEMKINLPAIGNMMSKAWDIIHGPNRDDARTDENGSLQGRLDSFKDIDGNQIPVKRSNDGTLVGTNINGNSSRTVTDITKESLHIDDKTQDDAWIKTAIDTNGLTDAKNSNNNGISIHHTFTSTPDTTSASNKNTDGVASTNASDKIELYTPHVDAAGHVVGKNIETVTLPYGFKTITTNGREEDTNTVNNGEMLEQKAIIADNTQDTLSINSGNKWVRIDTDADSDTVTISHDVHDFDTDSAGHTNLNTEENAKKEDNLTIYDWDYDKAGHIISKKEHTYTLPFSYKTIALGSASEAVAEITSNTTSLVADTTQDTLTIAPGNKWIALKADASTDTISIGHAAAGGTTITTSGATEPTNNETKTLNFGETFTTSYVRYDEMGHITDSGTREVTVPIGSLADTSSTNAANVLTGIDFTAQTGAIKTTHQNASALLLTGHTDTTTGHVLATDSISGAFSKLDERIDDTNTRIDNLDVTDTATSGEVVSTVQQTDGKIAVAHTNVGTLILTGYTLPTAVSNLNLSPNESLNTALGKLEFRINNLDYSDESTTQVISKITQTDGKIAVTRANAGDLLLTGYVKAQNGAEVLATDSINTAFGKITKNLDEKTAALSKELTDTIAGLDVDKIEAGKGKVLESVSEADGKISATSKSLGGIIITDYIAKSDTTDIANTDTLNEALGKLQAQINANVSAIEELTDGTTVEGINSVKELVEWTEAHGTTTAGIISTIGKAAEGENASTGLYALIDAEANARAASDRSITERIDNLPATNITTEQITKWEKAEENIQADWNQIDSNADDFIKNKPTDLVRTSDITNMAVKSDLTDMVIKSDIANMATKSDLTDMVVKSDIANMVETTTSFVYISEVKDETTGEVIVPEESMTIAQLVEKIKILETRIIELEAKHTEDSNEEEVPTE